MTRQDVNSRLLNMQAGFQQRPVPEGGIAYHGGMPRPLSRPRPRHGARLFELRKAANLSQTELAELVGETQTNIAYWEQSDKPPRSDVLPKLAEILGVRVENLLFPDSQPRRRGGPVGKVRRVFEEVSQLPKREQKKIVDTVSALVNGYRHTA